MIMILLICQNTKGNNDFSFAPMSEEGMLPNPMSCVADGRNIPDCVKAVKHGHFKKNKKECCMVLLGIPEDCFGIIFPMRFAYRVVLKMTCKLINIKY